MGIHQMSAGELYACLYATEFPAQAVLRLRPELRARSVAIVEGDPPLQSVCSMNATARTMGVARGMTRVELDTFEFVTVLHRSRSEEAAARAIMLECAGGFSPRIEEVSDCSAFRCVIDIAGTERLLGSPQELAKELLRRVCALGIAATVAISANFYASVSFACGGVTRIGINLGSEPVALSRLPLKVLNLSSEQAETLALWGIHSLGALAALPETELIARMGHDGKRLREMAQGRHAHHFVPIEAKFRLEERMELEAVLEQLESLFFVVSVMLEQLIIRATVRVLALASVTITLTLEGDSTHTRCVCPALPSNDRQLWIKLLHLDLEAHPPQAAILAVMLSAEPSSISKVQLGLFSPQLPESSRLDVTLARIRAIVGEDCVGRPVLEDTHRSDSFRMEPFTVPTQHTPRARRVPSPVAMRRLRPPPTVAVNLQGRRPASFQFGQSRYNVEHLYGPWLEAVNWWDSASHSVEQWDLIALSDVGERLVCCLVRDVTRDIWQVVALYD